MNFSARSQRKPKSSKYLDFARELKIEKNLNDCKNEERKWKFKKETTPSRSQSCYDWLKFWGESFKIQ